MSGKRSGPAVTGSVWARFAKTAVLWLIPALLVLPIYLVVLGLSVAASDGSLLEASGGVRGGVNAALGPLLVLAGAAAGVFTAMFAYEAQDIVGGAFFAIVTVGLGIALMTRELRRMAATN